MMTSSGATYSDSDHNVRHDQILVPLFWTHHSLCMHASKYVGSVGVSHPCMNTLLRLNWRVVGVVDELNVHCFVLSLWVSTIE